MSSFKHNNKNVPKLRFPGFEGEWETKTIKEIAPLQRGFDLPTDKLQQGVYPVIYSNGIRNYHSEFKCKAPGVLTGRSGTIGKVFFVNDDYWAHNTTLWVTDFFNNSPKFIYYMYQSINIEQFSSGSGVPTLNRNDVHEYKTGIPSVKEQQKIATFLSLIDERISKQRELVEKLKTYKRGVIQSVFGGNSLNKFSSNNWGRITIKDLFQSINDRNHSDECVLTIIQGKGTIPRDSVERRITYNKSSVSSYKKVKKNDFILHLRSFEGGLEIANEDGIVSPAYTILRANNSINPIFFYSYFRSYDFINNKLRVAVEGIRDGKSINMDTFWNIEIPYPCMTEQNYIADLLSKLDEYTNNQTLQFKKLISLKSALLQQMFI